MVSFHFHSHSGAFYHFSPSSAASTLYLSLYFKPFPSGEGGFSGFWFDCIKLFIHYKLCIRLCLSPNHTRCLLRALRDGDFSEFSGWKQTGIRENTREKSCKMSPLSLFCFHHLNVHPSGGSLWEPELTSSCCFQVKARLVCVCSINARNC